MTLVSSTAVQSIAFPAILDAQPPIGNLSLWVATMVADLVASASKLRHHSLQDRTTAQKSQQDSNAQQVFWMRIAAPAHLGNMLSIQTPLVEHIVKGITTLFDSNSTSADMFGRVCADTLQQITTVLSATDSFIEKICSLWQQVIQSSRLS